MIYPILYEIQNYTIEKIDLAGGGSIQSRIEKYKSKLKKYGHSSSISQFHKNLLSNPDNNCCIKLVGAKDLVVRALLLYSTPRNASTRR